MRDDAAAAVVDVALEGGQQGAGLYPAVPVVEATAAEAGVAARANAGAEVVYAFGGAYGQVVGDFELAPVDELAVEVEFQVVGADAAGHDLHLLPVGPGHALAATQQGGHAAFGRGQFRAREVQRPGGPGRQAFVARALDIAALALGVAGADAAGVAAQDLEFPGRVGLAGIAGLDVALDGLAVGALGHVAGLDLAVAGFHDQGQARGGINAGPYGDGAAIDGDGIADDGAGIGPDQRYGGAAAAGVQARHAAGQAFDGDDVPVGVLALPGDGLVLLALLDAAATHAGVRGLIDQRAVEAAADVQLRALRHVGVADDAHFLEVGQRGRVVGHLVGAVAHIGLATAAAGARGFVVDAAFGAAGDGDAALVVQGAGPGHGVAAIGPAFRGAHVDAAHVELKVAQGQQFVAGGSIGAGHGEGDVAQAAHGAAAVAVAARLDVELAARDKGAAAVAEAARGVDVDLAGRAALAIDRALVAETRALDADVLAQQVGTVAVADRAAGLQLQATAGGHRAGVGNAAGAGGRLRLAALGQQRAPGVYAGGVGGDASALGLAGHPFCRAALA